MDYIKSFLEGNLDATVFIEKMQTDPLLVKQIKGLIPRDAHYNPNHMFWQKVGYNAYIPDKFDCIKHIKRVCFDGSAWVDLNVFGTLKDLYTASNPDIKCTSYYTELYHFYLSVVGEYFEGKESEQYLKNIAISKFNIRPKSKRNNITKELIRGLFHVEHNRIPRWIQGAEWPMGTKTPMQYIGSRKIKDDLDEGREYLFRDFETGKERSIIQYY